MVKGSAASRSADVEPAVLGQGLRVVGRVRGQGDLRIEAEVEGDVSVTGNLHLDEVGQITGSVDAESVVVAGSLNGDATARGAVAITATGRVRGTIRAPELSLEEGGGLEGDVEAEFDLPEAIA
jgi:cytoskeletal protein CcmA (bactofilin family)